MTFTQSQTWMINIKLQDTSVHFILQHTLRQFRRASAINTLTTKPITSSKSFCSLWGLLFVMMVYRRCCNSRSTVVILWSCKTISTSKKAIMRIIKLHFTGRLSFILQATFHVSGNGAIAMLMTVK